MLRLCVAGSRADGERAAKVFGISHIGWEDPGPDEGELGAQIMGMCDDVDLDKVELWFNSDPPHGITKGSLLWFKTTPVPRIGKIGKPRFVV